MTTTAKNQNRRLSTSSSLAKRSASSENNVGKAMTSGSNQRHCQQQPVAKKRPALANVTNQRANGTTNNNSSRSSLSESSKLVCLRSYFVCRF